MRVSSPLTRTHEPWKVEVNNIVKLLASTRVPYESFQSCDLNFVLRTACFGRWGFHVYFDANNVYVFSSNRHWIIIWLNLCILGVRWMHTNQLPSELLTVPSVRKFDRVRQMEKWFVENEFIKRKLCADILCGTFCIDRRMFEFVSLRRQPIWLEWSKQPNGFLMPSALCDELRVNFRTPVWECSFKGVDRLIFK